MNAIPTSARAVVRIIEGITALCLGSAENLIWVDHTDAAAFSDGEHLYLPRPLGFHEEEYGLLLALALREVARIWHSKAQAFEHLHPGELTYCALVEEVRVEMYLARTFRGAPAIFSNAAGIVCAQRILAQPVELLEAEDAKALLVWTAVNTPVLITPELGDALNSLVGAVQPQIGGDRLDQVMSLAQGAAGADSTEVAIELGARIWSLLHPEQPAGETFDAGSQEGGNANEGEMAAADTQVGPSAGQGDQASAAIAASAEQPDDQPTAPDNAGREPKPGTPCQEDARQATGSPSAADRPVEAGPDQPRSKPQEPQTPSPGPTSDFVSDALAMLKGHPHAVSYADQAAALREQAGNSQSGSSTISETGQAMIAALLAEADADRGLLGTTAGFLVQDGRPEKGLSSVVGAGGGPPQAPDQASRTLLDAIPARLVTVLLRELQDVRRRPVQHSVTGPRLAAAKLWRLSRLGDTRLFRKKAPATGIDAVVSLLLDRSASMQRHGFGQAVEITQAFLLALQRIHGVKTSLDVFPGLDMPIEQILAFGQNHAKARERLRELEPQGGTPTGSAVARRLRQMLDVVAPTKLMVVITDGQPDRDEIELLGVVLAQAAMFQVQVVGIGIGINLQHRFAVSVSVRNAGELPDALAALFREQLLQR